MRHPETIAELLRTATAAVPEDPFLLWDEGPWTSFAAFAREARRFAGGLRARGIGRGERVAILMDNRPEHLTASWGTMLAGAVAVPIHTELTAPEAAWIVTHAEPRMLVTEERHRRRAGEVLNLWAPEQMPELVVAPPRAGEDGDRPPSEPDSGWHGALAEPLADGAIDIAGEDLALIQYTSGTTARPKGALLEHRALCIASGARARHLGYRTDDTIYVPHPLSHLNAQATVMMAMAARMRLVLRERFSASRFWDDVRRHRVTTLNGMQTIPRILLARDPEPNERDNSLRFVVGALPPEQQREFETRFDVVLVPVYALTEDPMSVLGPPQGLPADRARSGVAGRPIEPEVHAIRIVDEAGRDLGPDRVGEIVKRSPAMMQGYFKDPEATAAALRDGWLHTGDLGYLDEDGYLYFAGRKKDAIRRSGEMISAAEVEAALIAHPAVADAAVIGVEDPIRSEEVKAFVMLTGAGRGCRAPELLAHCADRLASFKVPRYLEFRRDLPRTATGKVRKDVLRAGEPAAGEVYDREVAGPAETADAERSPHGPSAPGGGGP